MEIRRLTWTDRKPAAGCLAQAFEFDPLMACLIPDARVRGRLLFRFCDLASMLQRLDQTSDACTLETANARNVSIYQRFGFQVLDETRVPGSSLDLWFMLRNA